MGMKELGEVSSALVTPSIDIDLDSIVNSIGKEVNLMPIELHHGSRVPNTLSTGCLSWDLIIGGGYGKGKWTTIFGPEGAGKSTAVYHAIKEAIVHRGMRCLHFAHEASDDPSYMKQIGVPIGDPKYCDENLKSKYYRYYQPETGEQTFRLISKLLNELPDSSGEAPPSILIVIDSLAAMMPEMEMDDKHPMAAQARMFSTYMRAIKARLSRKGCIILATNQLRMDPGAWGNPEIEPGGQAPRFYPDIKIRINMIGGNAPKNVVIEGGYQYRDMKVRTTKNKQFPPFQEIEAIRIRLGYGFDPLSDALNYLKLTGQITVRGSWYVCEEALEIPKFQWAKGAHILETSEVRNKLKAQLVSGEAFDKYFKNRGLVSNYELPEESSKEVEPKEVELNEPSTDPNKQIVEQI